jgi:DNA-binding response OmpR family regulator
MENSNKPIILVVEDEVLLLHAITKKLEFSEFGAVGCDSGEAAIKYLQETEKLPDAIWLDYNLQDMDGLTFMAQVKANEKWKNIPVVVVSNSVTPDKVSHMMALGAKQYILKADYRLDEIIATIHKFIEKEHTS